MKRSVRIAAIAGLAAAALIGLAAYGPILQDPSYHRFFDRRTIWGIPNFWNVVSNVPFLLVALYGLRALKRPESFAFPWERAAHAVLMAGCALTFLGSSYYHWQPTDQTLFWDRLPMSLLFMALLAATIGERISFRAGRILLAPLLLLGVASVLFWRYSGDLRLYGFVQFFTIAALPLIIVLFPPRYSGAGAMFGMLGFYAAAKSFEVFDRQIGHLLSTGGHPWKHAAAAAAMAFYIAWVERRRLLQPDAVPFQSGADRLLQPRQ